MTQDEQWLLAEKYNGQKTAGFLDDQARLLAGEPLAYLIGHVPFLHSTIFLDSHPLIPRPETEYWTEKLIAQLKEKKSPLQILDLCAGSGCIGIALAQELPSVQVDFAEIDSAHRKTIAKNCHVNQIQKSRYQVYTSNLYFDLPKKTYDYIVSNPPYIDSVLQRTEESVTKFEPHQALFGGAKGLEIIHRIITETPNWLASGGQLWLEHEPEHALAIAEMAASTFIVHTYTDQYSLARYSVLVLQ